MDRCVTSGRLTVGARDLLEGINALSSRWEGRAFEADASARLSQATYDELREASLLSLCVPRRYGGHALPWNNFMELSSAIARACPATAWLVGLVGSHAAIVSRMAEGCQEDVFGDDPQHLVATASLQKAATVSRRGADFVVSGVWGISSGIEFATWVVLYVRHEFFGGEPHLLVLSKSQVSYKDDWNVLGLRATGSQSIEVSEAVVPSHRCIAQGICFGENPPGARLNAEAPYYVNPYVPYLSTVILGPLTGTASGALSAGLVMLRKSYERAPDEGARALTEIAVSESVTELRTANMLVKRLSETLAGSDRPTDADWNALRQDKAYATRLCERALDRLAYEIGTGGVFLQDKFQRQWRDFKVMSKHMDVRWSYMMRPAGQALMKTPDHI